ncbi:hypothetical protein OXT66_01735 [Lentilactobacillus senioris]|uniref:hypothetical protein n=1 Tax=Lentilactobacillus senioris TaxID=931534 RepID=UPI00227E7EAE|nr:hypothetical protein [Lentilactobacillus senioris]MCY9806266.1 hypothetical protein [Lentilactobacillus senioris]
MVKQGQRAASRRQKQMKQRLKQKVKRSQRTINIDQLPEFMLVRYGLTLKKRLPKLSAETLQRLLQAMLEMLPAGEQWSLTLWLIDVLKTMNNQLPWQFYLLVAENWSQFQAFLVRELPAVPLTQPLIISDEVREVELITIVSHQLAVNFFLTTTQNNPALMRQLPANQIEELQSSLNDLQAVDWPKVASLLGPVEPMGDAGTQAWLTALNQLAAEGSN